MVDAVFSEIDLPQVDLGWKPAMRHRAQSARAVFLRQTIERSADLPGAMTPQKQGVGGLG